MASSSPTLYQAVVDDDDDLWSELPADLIATISTRLNFSDRTRFRAVCNPWRFSAATSLQSLTALLNLFKIAYPKILSKNSSISLSLADKHNVSFDPNRTSYTTVGVEFRRYFIKSAADHDPISRTGFIGQTMLSEFGKKTCPYVDERLRQNSAGILKSVDLLEARVYQLSLWNAIMFVGSDMEILFMFDIVSSAKDAENCCVGENKNVCLMGIVQGNLLHLKLGDEKWSLVGKADDTPCCYCDIMYRKCKGMFYAVDYLGNVVIVDNSGSVVEEFKWPIPTTDFLLALYNEKLLVESEGQLFQVVHRRNCKSGEKFGKGKISKEKDDVKILIYRLDEGQTKWRRVRKLGDRAFFVQQFHSFAVSGKDFPGLRMNRVYFDGSAYASMQTKMDDLNAFNVETSYWGQFSHDC